MVVILDGGLVMWVLRLRYISSVGSKAGVWCGVVWCVIVWRFCGAWCLSMMLFVACWVWCLYYLVAVVGVDVVYLMMNGYW